MEGGERTRVGMEIVEENMIRNESRKRRGEGEENLQEAF